jgi:RHS repeat-associated protein
VVQQVTQGGSTTTTIYVGDVEEVSTVGSTTQTTTYYYANGKRIALGVNGQVSYLASDALGSATLAFGSSGTATASQLFAPYGRVRYTNGIMPTSFGFTGQRGDSVSGLNYFHARYLDPLLGQFTSADNRLQGGGYDILGLSRYAYVEGNPVGRTDPTGHEVCIDDRMGGCVVPDPGVGGDSPPPDPGLPPDPCEGSSNCNGNPGAGLDPCGGLCGGAEPGPAPNPGSEDTPVSPLPPDSGPPPNSDRDSGRTHCMCSDPGADQRLETIPLVEQIFGSIFDPAPEQRVIDEALTIELGPTGLLINVHWPASLRIVSEQEEPTDVTGIVGPGGEKIGRPGRSPGVRVIDTVEEMEQIFQRLITGGKPIDSTYPGDLVQHPDGSTVGRRPTSRTGGPAIDITLPDGTEIKVHLP